MLQQLVNSLKIPARNVSQGGGKGFLQTTTSKGRFKKPSEHGGRGDFYELLGLSQSATPKRIKQAYYELAKKYHPDTNFNDAAADRKFKEITEAYKILSDDMKRREYDQREVSSHLRRFVNDSDDLLKKAFRKIDVAHTDFGKFGTPLKWKWVCSIVSLCSLLRHYGNS
jgi:DnaJ domain